MDGARLEPARLLVVDDDPILREFALANLTTGNVMVEAAPDGMQGWRRLCEGKFDIAMIDLDMPVVDGFELIGRIRKSENLYDLPIVIVTGRSDIASIERAYAAGATSFVLKPLNWPAVSHQLSYVLRTARENARIRANARALRRRLRAQDETLNVCQDGIDRLFRVLLEEAPQSALQTGDAAPITFARLWAELDQLRNEIKTRAGEAR